MRRQGRAVGTPCCARQALAAPFIGLVYAVTFPFVGIAMLLWTAVEALTATIAKIEVPALRLTPAYAA